MNQDRIDELIRCARLHPLTSALYDELYRLLQERYEQSHDDTCMEHWDRGLQCPHIPPSVTMDELYRIKHDLDVDPGFGPN